jgi:hypothetical protein
LWKPLPQVDEKKENLGLDIRRGSCLKEGIPQSEVLG